MTPASYREQHLNCCGTCKYWTDVDGLMNMVCGFGETLDKNSFNDAAYHRERDMERAGQNWFDRGTFQDQFMKGRWANAWDICDEYTKAEAIA
jgi:hypothetical protein